jgi:hypothetical protein
MVCQADIARSAWPRTFCDFVELLRLGIALFLREVAKAPFRVLITFGGNTPKLSTHRTEEQDPLVCRCQTLKQCVCLGQGKNFEVFVCRSEEFRKRFEGAHVRLDKREISLLCECQGVL